jgi:hypothetical protein
MIPLKGGQDETVVAGAVVQIKFAAVWWLLQRDLDADSRVLVSGVGRGWHPVRGGAVEGVEAGGVTRRSLVGLVTLPLG